MPAPAKKSAAQEVGLGGEQRLSLVGPRPWAHLGGRMAKVNVKLVPASFPADTPYSNNTYTFTSGQDVTVYFMRTDVQTTAVQGGGARQGNGCSWRR